MKRVNVKITKTNKPKQIKQKVLQLQNEESFNAIHRTCTQYNLNTECFKIILHYKFLF